MQRTISGPYLIMLFLAIVLMCGPSTYAANFTSVASGNWDTPATWGGATFPGTGDNVTIAAGHTVTYNVPGTAGGANDVTVNGTLNVPAGFTFRLNHVALVNAGGTIQMNGTLNVFTTTFTNAINNAGTVTGNGLVVFQTIGVSAIFATFGPSVEVLTGDLTINSSANIAGDLTVRTGCSVIAQNGAQMSVSGTATVNTGGGLFVQTSGGEFIFKGPAFVHDGTMSSSRITFDNSASPGTPTMIGGSGTWTVGSAPSVINITVAAGATATLQNDMTWTMNLLTVNGTLNTNGKNLTVIGTGGNAIIGNTGTLNINGGSLDMRMGSEFTNNGSITGNGTLKRQGGFSAFGNCTANVQVTGDMNIRGGTVGGFTVDAGARSFRITGTPFTINGNVLVNGNFSGNSADAAFFSGDSFTNNGFVEQSVTFNRTVGSPQTIGGTGIWRFGANAFPRLTLASGSTTTMTSSINLQHSVQIDGTLNTNGFQVQLDYSNSGNPLLGIGAAGNLNIGASTFVINYAGTGTDRFTNLGMVSGTGLVKFDFATNSTPMFTTLGTIQPSVEVTRGEVLPRGGSIGGNLTLAASGGIALASATLTVAGDLLNNGFIGSNGGTNTLNFNGVNYVNNGPTDNITVRFNNTGSPKTQYLSGAGPWSGSAGGNLLIGANSTTVLLNDINLTNREFNNLGRVFTGCFRLSMTASVAVTGNGDVFGRVRRTNPVQGVFYGFGDANTGIRFSGGTMPSEVTFNVSSNAARSYTNAVRRNLLISTVGGSNLIAEVGLSYKESELNGIAESALQIWTANGVTWTAQGFSQRDTTNNWVFKTGLTNFSKIALSGAATPISQTVAGDFDGDKKADFAYFRPANGTWNVTRSSNNTTFFTGWGLPNDRLVPGDYDGDGKTDHGVYRDGAWFILRSSDGGFVAQNFGLASDIPVQNDFDADGRTDIAVFRPSNGIWFILRSGDGGFEARPFGTNGDRPLPADYDGDGRVDLAVFRPSEGIWYFFKGLGQCFDALQFGIASDLTVPADFDGDGRADIAVFRPSLGAWFVLGSTQGFFVSYWGVNGDVPVAADYDGDGTTDVAVFRPTDGFWYVLQSSNGQLNAENFGAAGDLPVQSSSFQ